MTATIDLLDFAAAEHRLSGSVRSDTMRLLADTLAVGVAGVSAPGAEGVFKTASTWGAGSEARILGRQTRLPAASAAYVNAFQIHCLEWDAVHEPAVVHALSVVTAALLAAVDRKPGCTKDEILAALAVGVDVASGLGIAADTGLSFFRPATAGLIGAAMAVARIAGLPRAQFDDVLGLGYSHCAGTMQAHVEGSIALPLQIANAARAAIHVVDLVSNGLTGPHDALEGPFGYFTLFDQGDLSRYTATLGQTWLIGQVSTKPYPSGRASHAALGALAGFSSTNISRIEAFVPPLVQRLVGRPFDPGMTPAYARLCLPLLAALMLKDGVVDPRRFAPAAFADDDVRAIASRLTITLDDNQDPNALFPQRVIVTLDDGTSHEIAIPSAPGSPDAALSSTQISSKYALCRTLAGDCDPRIFDDPLSYVMES